MAAPRPSSYTYTADIMMALCEGPINGIGLVWKDLSVYFLAELGLGNYNGTTPQAVWPYLAALYPYNALAYQGTAYVWGAGYNLGDSASIGNHNFEIYGILSSSGVNGIDADPAYGHPGFPDQRPVWLWFQSGQHRFWFSVHQPGFIPGLLLGDGLRVLASACQPRTGIEHPDAMAATVLDGGRMEWRSPEIHPLW